MTGSRAEDFVRVLSPLDFLAPEDIPRVREVFDEAFRTGRPSSYEVYVPRFDRWYVNAVGPIQSDGRVEELSLLARDITEAKRVERAQKRSERRLQLALASVQVGLVEIDLDSGEHVYSAPAYELLGFSPGGLPQTGTPPGIYAVLHKPFRISALIQCVQSCLASRTKDDSRAAQPAAHG